MRSKCAVTLLLARQPERGMALHRFGLPSQIQLGNETHSIASGWDIDFAIPSRGST